MNLLVDCLEGILVQIRKVGLPSVPLVKSRVLHRGQLHALVKALVLVALAVVETLLVMALLVMTLLVVALLVVILLKGKVHILRVSARPMLTLQLISVCKSIVNLNGDIFVASLPL